VDEEIFSADETVGVLKIGETSYRVKILTKENIEEDKKEE